MTQRARCAIMIAACIVAATACRQGPVPTSVPSPAATGTTASTTVPAVTLPPPTATLSPTRTDEPSPTQPSPSPTATIAPSPSPAPRRIEFYSGATSAVVEGHLAAGAVDEYILRAQGGQVVTASVGPANGSVVLEIYGLEDEQVLLRRDGRQTSFRTTLPTTQDYALNVVAIKGDIAYTLQVTIPPLAQARRIQFPPGGTSTVVEGSLPSEGSEEFLVAAQAGQTMAVSVFSPQNDVVLEIYGLSDGRPLLRSHLRQTYWQSVLPATQDYSIKAVSTGDPATYSLQVVIRPLPTATPTGEISRITFEPGATSALIQATLSAERIDEYRVSAAAAQVMMVSIYSPDNSVVLTIWGIEDGQPLVRSAMEQTSWRGELPATQDYGIKASGTAGATPYALQVIIPERVEFPWGAISAERTGVLRSRETHEYVMRAAAGQTMTVAITSPGNLVLLEIYGLADGQPLLRVPAGVSTWTGVLPATQDYDVKAVSVSDAAATYHIYFEAR